jgi:hypothetical protein
MLKGAKQIGRPAEVAFPEVLLGELLRSKTRKDAFDRALIFW